MRFARGSRFVSRLALRFRLTLRPHLPRRLTLLLALVANIALATTGNAEQFATGSAPAASLATAVAPMAAPASSTGPTAMAPLQTNALAPIAPFWSPSGVVYDGLPSDVEKTNPFTPFLPASDFAQQPGMLGRPLAPAAPEQLPTVADAVDELFLLDREAPLGFTGPSGILPRETQQNSHFLPIEDRWRLGFPYWDRYDQGHPPHEDQPFMEGQVLDPYNQNVLKGDFPIIGQHTFLNMTATSFMIQEFREVPTATTPFESTLRPFSEEFFGKPNQYFYSHYLVLAADLFHGNEAFKPLDWKIRLQPVFNFNFLDVEELAVVHPDVRRGTQRDRSYWALEQWFVEAKLADLGPDYDFLSVRGGSQPFVSDFRGFVFKDVNRGVRLFGTRHANRDQFNAIWFDQTEKDTNSELNEFNDRHQNTVIFNYFRQDFVFPGFTGLLSFHYNHDKPSFHFDDNFFLARPDPVGVFRPHEINAYYIGLGGDGHIGRLNISTQFYQVLGTDSLNPIAGEPQDINAQMAAVELSVDRDWVRFRASYFFSSGDDDLLDGEARGFDTIFDDPIFAGGEFSYWQRQAIRLFGVNLTQRKSLVPNLRASKIEGQSNFVNPGLHLFNLGVDFEVTKKLRAILNANYLMFDTTEVLDTFTFQPGIDRGIGTDISLGVEYRPLLNDNIILLLGSAVFIPADGFRDLFGRLDPFTIAEAKDRNLQAHALNSHFLELVLTY